MITANPRFAAFNPALLSLEVRPSGEHGRLSASPSFNLLSLDHIATCGNMPS